MRLPNHQYNNVQPLGYIFGARLKSQPAALRAEILDDASYAPLGGGVRVRSLARISTTVSAASPGGDTN